VLYTRLAEIQDAKIPKIRHLRTIAQIVGLYLRNKRYVSRIGKQLVKQQYLPHMFSQCGELRPSNGWDWFVSLGHPSKF